MLVLHSDSWSKSTLLDTSKTVSASYCRQSEIGVHVRDLARGLYSNRIQCNIVCLQSGVGMEINQP